MVNFWKVVDKVIDEADVVLEVIDARMIDKTRNIEIERKVRELGKVLIRVINKADLVQKEELDKVKKKLEPCVFISAKKFLGTTMLRKKILQYSRGESVLVGVVGYPNTGKSSVINALKGKASAPVSSVSGFTKGRQIIRADNKIQLLDTPGVLSNSDVNNDKSIKIATKNFYDEKDPDLAVYDLICEYKKEILEHYKIEDGEPEDILEKLAIKFNRVKSGGKPDIDTMAKIILKDWQQGKIQL